MIDESLPTLMNWLIAIAAFGGISALLAVALNAARRAFAVEDVPDSDGETM